MTRAKATILQIIPRLDTGGAELSTVEMTDAIVRVGARALVVTAGGQLTERIEALGGEVIALPVATKNPIGILRNAQRLATLVERENVDLIHARSRAPAWSAFMAARRTKRPFVTTYHGAYSETNAFKRWYNGIMARADKIIANSQYTADLIQSRYATSLNRISIIYRGIDIDTFNPANISAERIAVLRQQWQVPANARIILHPARLTKWKGHDIVIEAAAHLANAEHNQEFVIVCAGDDQGRTDYRADLLTAIDSKGLAGTIRLVGHVDDMPAAYLASHATLIASTEPEAFGRTSIESQAMGCPVIATRLGAPPETVLAPPTTAAAARTGWLIAPGAPDELAATLRQALAMPLDERDKIHQRARQNVTSRFTLRAMQDQTLAVYDQLMNKKLL